MEVTPECVAAEEKTAFSGFARVAVSFHFECDKLLVQSEYTVSLSYRLLPL